MAYDTIITGGTVVHADRTERADVAIRGEKIARIARGLARQASASTRVIDAAGCYVIPGGVDVHTHLALPFCGTVSADDFDSGTRAAARGGVTTVVDFATPYGDDTLLDALRNWQAKAEGIACIDYGFHMCLTNWDRQKKDIPRIIERGIPTFKQFMIYEAQGWRAGDAEIYNALELLRDHDGMLLVHAESSGVLNELISRHHHPKEMKKHGAWLHAVTRPNVIEAEAVQRAITWAEATGGRLYIVHLSSADGVERVRAARERRGSRIFAETCPQYLSLDESRFKGKDGHLFGTCPQIKKPSDQRALWRALKRGTVSTVATDTCTFDRKQKALWKGDWTKIPMGMPGLETMLPIVYTDGVLERRLTIREMVSACCTAPARLMGLGHCKGRLARGYDADIAILDKERRLKVEWRKMETNCDWSPFQGRSLAGFARTTLSRGRVIVDDWKFCGENGWGRYIPRRNPGRL